MFVHNTVRTFDLVILDGLRVLASLLGPRYPHEPRETNLLLTSLGLLRSFVLLVHVAVRFWFVVVPVCFGILVGPVYCCLVCVFWAYTNFAGS